jgi:hypothetical protein
MAGSFQEMLPAIQTQSKYSDNPIPTQMPDNYPEL